MTGKTHRAGGFICSVVGFELLRRNGLLVNGVNEGLQWLVMYPFCCWGSVASDLDHNPNAIPLRDPPARVINKVLHLTAPVHKFAESHWGKRSKLYKVSKSLDASHRSWQTHSDLTMLALLFAIRWVCIGGFKGTVGDTMLLSLILMGVLLGLSAHFFLDMLTVDGVHSIVLKVVGRVLRIKNFPEKLRFVPKISFFRTGDNWENFVYRVLGVLNAVALLYLVCVVFHIKL